MYADMTVYCVSGPLGPCGKPINRGNPHGNTSPLCWDNAVSVRVLRGPGPRLPYKLRTALCTCMGWGCAGGCVRWAVRWLVHSILRRYRYNQITPIGFSARLSDGITIFGTHFFTKSLYDTDICLLSLILPRFSR